MIQREVRVSMTRRQRVLPSAMVCVVLGALAPAALGKTHFRPRVGGALGLIPPSTSRAYLAPTTLRLAP